MSDSSTSLFSEDEIVPPATSAEPEEIDPIFTAPPVAADDGIDPIFSSDDSGIDPIFESLGEDPKARTPYYQLLQDRFIEKKFFRGSTTTSGDLKRNEDGTWNAPYMVEEIEGKGFFSKLAAGFQSMDAFLGQKTGRTTDSMWQDEGTRENFNEMLYAFQKDYNLSTEEVQAAWKDMQAIHRPMDEAEPLRTLSDGRILPNPANPVWLDTELAEANIRTSSGSAEEKAYMIENLEELQGNIALRQIESFALGNVSLSLGDMALDGGKNWEGPIEWAKRQGREFEPMNPVFVKDYRKDVIDKRGLIDGLQSDATLGVMKVANTIYGVGGIFGSEDAQKKSMEGVESMSLIRAGKKQTGVLGSVIEEIPSLALQIGATLATGGAGAGVAGAFGASAATTARVAAFSGNFAAVSMSGVQSAAMTYGQLRSQGLDHEEARSKSIDAGTATAIITGVFQAAGMGGAEAAMVRGNAANKLMRDLYSSMNRDTLAKASAAFVKSIPKAYIGEFTEEGLDEVVNSFLTSDPDQPIPTAWNDAIHAAFVGGAIGAASGIVTGSVEKSLQWMGMDKTAKALATNVTIAEEAVPSLAEARAQGIDPNTLVPSEVGSDSVVLKSKVNKKDGVGLARSGAKPTFLETIFGTPGKKKEYNEDFDRSSDFELEPIPGTKLEAVVHRAKKVKKGQEVRRYLDKAFDHETEMFVDLPADVKASIESTSGIKVHPREFFETYEKPPEETKPAPEVASTQDSFPEAPTAPTQPAAAPGILTPEEITKQPTADLRKKNDEYRAVLRENVTKDDDASRSLAVTAQEGIDRISRELNRRTSDPAFVEPTQTSSAPAVVPTDSLPEGQTGAPAAPQTAAGASIGAPQLPQQDETKTESNTAEEKGTDNQEAPEQENGQAVLRATPLPDEEETLNTSGQTATPANYATQGVRIHNQSELGKMVMVEDVEVAGQGVDDATGAVKGPKRSQAFYMDSHETETEGGGTNENVTIGAMPVGTLVLGKGESGKATKAYRVLKTQPLKNGGVRHYVMPLFDQDTEKLDQSAVDSIYAHGVSYVAKSRELEKAADGLIRSYLDGKAKADSQEVRVEVRKMVLDAFTYMVGPGFTKDNVVFENIPSPMHVTVENGKPVIKVNLDRYVADFISIAGRIDRSNQMGMQQVMFDLVERLRIAGLEELVHHQVIVDWGLDTENGTKLAVSVNQILDIAPTNEHAKAELAKSARWVFGNETAGMTDQQIVDFLTKRRETDQDMFNQDAWRIGHEMMASLYSRMKVGKDAASMNASAAKWAETMANGDQSLGKVLVSRLIELANRYFQAIRDYFKAYESVSHLPKDMVGLLRNLEDLMDKAGIKASDTIGVQAAAVKQRMDVLDHPAVFAKDGYEFAQAQKQLREVVSAMRQARNDEDWIPITLAADGSLIVTDEAKKKPEEASQIQELLDKLNSNKRASLTRRALEASLDLNRMMTWINRAALTKQQKSKDEYGNDIEKTVSNFRQVLDQPLNAVVKAFGPREVQSTVLAAINQAIPKALQASMGVTPEMLANPPDAVAHYENNMAAGDSVGRKLIGRARDARDRVEKATQELDAFNAEQEMLSAQVEEINLDQPSLETLGQFLRFPQGRAVAIDEVTNAQRQLALDAEANRKKLVKEVVESDKALQEALINRDRYVRKASTVDSAQAKMLSLVFADEDAYRSYLAAVLAPENRSIQSISELVSRRTSNPRLMDFAIRVAYPKGGIADAAIDEIQSTAELGGAVGRLMRFKEELNYMLMGGAKPRHMWSDFGFSDVGGNVAAGRLADFALLPQLSKGSFSSALMDVETYDFTNQPEGRVKGREGFQFGNFSVRSDGNDLTLQAMASGLIEGWTASSSLFGIAPLAKDVRGLDGLKLTGAEKGDLMSSNARYINNFLIRDVYAANRNGDHRIPTEVLHTMGFSLPYGETVAQLEGDSTTRYPTYPSKLIELPARFSFDETAGERDFLKENLDLINSPQFTEVVRSAVRYMVEATTPNRSRTPSVFFHASGLTPAGLAFQAIAPKLIEFLALTKEWSPQYDGKTFSPYDVLSQDPEIKAAYDTLMAGVEKTKPIADIREKIGKSRSPYEIVARFWELHRGAKVANTIYSQAKQSGSNSKSMSWHLKQADSKLPISVDALQNSSFITKLLTRNFRPSQANSKTFISLMRPIRAQRGIDLYNSIAPETDELVIRKKQTEGAQISQDIVGSNEGDVVSRSSDIGLQDEKALPMAQMYGYGENSDKGLNLIEQDRLNRQMRRERLEKWRSEMLLALLGGDPDSVIQFIHGEGFMVAGTDANGDTVALFDEDAIDQAILDELERLRSEEIERGTVIDSSKQSYKEAIKSLKSRTTDEAQLAAIDMVQKHPSLVQKSVGLDTVQVEPAAFDADAYSLLTSITSSIPNLVFIEGSANWELQADGPPAIVFIPDAEAPTLIMPYGGKVAASNAETQSALADMFLWSQRNGGADLIGNANRVLDVLSYEGLLNPGLRKVVSEQVWKGLRRLDDTDLTPKQISDASVDDALKKSGAFDKKTRRAIMRKQARKPEVPVTGAEVVDFLDYDYENRNLRGALVESLVSKIVDERKGKAIRLMDTRLDERIGQTVAGPLFLQTLTDGAPQALTNEQAAAILVAAMTDRSVQEAMMLSIASEPLGPNPSLDKLALRGNLLSPSLLSSFTDRLREQVFGELADSFKVTDSSGRTFKSEDEGYSGVLSDAVSEQFAGTLQTGPDSATTSKGDILAVGTMEQAEWLSSLLHSLVDGIEPKFESQADIDLINIQNEQLGTKTTVGKTLPKGLVVSAPPEGISEMEARQILSVMSEEHLADLVDIHTEGKGLAVTKDLMQLNRERAGIVRQAYNRITNLERGNRSSEDAAFNYGTFSYDSSLWSDNSRKSVYEASRIMKGAINEGILDGGKIVQDGFGRDYVRVDADLAQIMENRLANGHAIFVRASDGTRLAPGQAEELNTSNPGAAIQDLEYDRRKYFEEIDGLKADIERYQANANRAINIMQQASEGVVEVEELFADLQTANDRQEAETLLKGASFMDPKTGWLDAPEIVRAAFDGPEQFASAVTDNIIDRFLEGVDEIGDDISYVPGAYAPQADKPRSQFAVRNDPAPPTLADEITQALAKNPWAQSRRTTPKELLNEAKAEAFWGLVKSSDTQESFRLVSTQAVNEMLGKNVVGKLSAIRKDIANWAEKVPEDDFGFGQEIAEMDETLQRRFDSIAADHNARVMRVVDRVNRRIPGLINPEQFRIVSAEESQAAMGRFLTILSALQSKAGLHLLLKDKAAKKAIAGASLADLAFNDRLDPTKPQESITSFDQILSKGVGMLDAMDRIKIGDEARTQIRTILNDDSITDKKALIAPIVQKDVFPLHNAAEVARTRLLDSMNRVLEKDGALVGANLALQALAIAKETRIFQDLPQSLEWAITHDVVKSLLQTRSREAQVNVLALLKQKAAMQAKYAYRRNSISAPRANHASRMVYEGGPDSVEILRKNHMDRGLTWSRNHMAAKNVRLGPNGQVYDQSNINGMEDALDRMSRADMLAATATVLTQIESKNYDVVGNLITPSGTLKPDGTTVIPLATAGYTLANSIDFNLNDDDTDAVKEAKAAYKMLMRSSFFRDLESSIKSTSGRAPGFDPVSSRLGDFDPIGKLKENLQRILINAYNANFHNANNEGAPNAFENLGNHPYEDVDGTTKVKESIKARLGPILERITPNATAAQIKDLVDIHNEIVAEVLAARSAHDIALGIVDGSRMDAGLLSRYLLNHDPSVRKAFAGNWKGQEAALDALGFLGSGSTGHSGRQGYASTKNAWATLFTEEEKKLKGSRKFEDAAAGVMFYRVVDFLRATGKTSQQRAQTLIEMFEQADQGFSDALSANKLSHIKGNKIKDIMSWPREKFNDFMNDLTGDTFEMLQQRKVYEELRDYWVPRLEMLKAGNSLDDMIDKVRADKEHLTPQAERWGRFVRDSMEHISKALQVSAMMNGMEPKDFIGDRALTPFRWRVFGREHQSTQQFPDYGDVLAVDKASYRQSPTRRPKPGEIHMLDISGFTGPLHVVDDALNRIMMADAYDAFKNFAGVSVTTQHNKRTLTQMGSLYHHGQRLHNDTDKNLAHAASARLASLGQDIIHKDVFKVTDKSMVMDAVQQVSRHGAVKALLSVKQIYAQVLPGLAAYSYIRQGMKGNADFPALFTKIVHSMVNGRLFRSDDLRVLGDNVDRFALVHGPLVYKRTAGGEEEYHKNISKVKPSHKNRSNRTFGDNSKAKELAFAVPNAVKKLAGVMVDVSDKMLHYAIATPESAFARSIFAHQIWKMVNESLPAGEKASFDDLVDPIKGKAYNITPAMTRRAETMVNDMIASTDTSKKADLLQQSDDAMTEMFRGIFATFANHPIHTWGNSWASMSMMKHGDEESKRDGRRLMASNVLQNMLFQLTRIEVVAQLVGVMAPLIAAVFTDLDDEERNEMRKRIVGSVYGINQDGTRKDGMGGAMRYIMMGLGSSNPMGFKEAEGWSDNDLDSDMANLMGRVLQEGLVQVIPGVATTLGSKGLEKAIEIVVKDTLNPEGRYNLERAGLVVGDGYQGNEFERAIYNVSKAYHNYVADLSYFTIGLNSLLDPITRLSNAKGDVTPLKAAAAFGSELPVLPRDFRSAMEKEVDASMDVKKWSAFWERKRKSSPFRF